MRRCVPLSQLFPDVLMIPAYKRGGVMRKIMTCLCIPFAVAALFVWIPKANATTTLYTNNCVSCHGTTPNTCAGCHAHGVHSSSAKNNINLTGATNKTTYAPGEVVSVTINGGYRSGWVRAVLYNQSMVEMARSTGTIGPVGSGGGASFPIILTAPAPAVPGTYTWNVSWYGNQNDIATATFGPRWRVDPNNPAHGEEIVSTNAFTVAAALVTSKVRVFRDGVWYVDMNGNGIWDPPADVAYNFGIPGDIPVTGDWNLTGTTKIGVFRNGQWFLDMNGNGLWDPPADVVYSFGIPGDLPVSGDWSNTGTTKIGVFRNGEWYLDMNGNGIWDPPADVVYSFGIPGDIAVSGDWNNSGTTKIGVFRNGQWYLDMNGNGSWDPATDTFTFFGIAGDLPVTGDWNGLGISSIGVFRNSQWYLDKNGNGLWDPPADVLYSFGIAGDLPVTGM